FQLQKPSFTYFFPHLVFAAFAAIWERFLGLRAAARAAPPLSPPKRPRATAFGFFCGSMGFSLRGSYFGTWPGASWIIRYASWFESRGRFVERSGIMPSVWQAMCQSQDVNGIHATCQ